MFIQGIFPALKWGMVTGENQPMTDEKILRSVLVKMFRIRRAFPRIKHLNILTISYSKILKTISANAESLLSKMLMLFNQYKKDTFRTKKKKKNPHLGGVSEAASRRHRCWRPRSRPRGSSPWAPAAPGCRRRRSSGCPRRWTGAPSGPRSGTAPQSSAPSLQIIPYMLQFILLACE